MDVDHLRMPRQRFIAGAGMAAAATALAACSSGGSAAPPVASQTPGGTAPAAADPKSLTTTAEVPVGSGVIVDGVVVTQPAAGDFKAFTAICTHRSCKLSEVADGLIDCPCHGSKFHLDGTVAAGPAAEPLAAVPISVDGDSIVMT